MLSDSKPKRSGALRSQIPMIKAISGNFRIYQQKQKYSAGSVKMHEYFLKRFKGWCIANNKDYNNIDYNSLLEYVKHLKSRKLKNVSINRILNSVGIYYDYLISIGKLNYNTARDIKLKDKGKKVLQNLLTPKQLDDIYNDFAKKPEWDFIRNKTKLLHKRNQVILGLMIYQGLASGELKKLEVSHVNLNGCKIYAPSSRRSSPRILKLQAVQIIPLHDYIKEIRPELLKKRDVETNRLFYDKKFNDLICRIIKEARRLNPLVESSRQIRSSVIMNWLRQYNIRQVQYMAGHKKIRSTEQYKKEDLRDLTKQLAKHHPLK